MLALLDLGPCGKLFLEGRGVVEFVGVRGLGLGTERQGIGAAEVEWPDQRLAGAADVEGEFERLGGVLGDVAARRLGGLFEAGGMVAGEHGRFDENDFLQLQALSERLGVVEEGVGEILVDEPEAGEGVAFDEGEEGIETGLFKA